RELAHDVQTKHPTAAERRCEARAVTTGTRRGYTMMEAMMSLAILGLGATGIIALQKATLVGNSNARNLAAANAIAMGWQERLRTDAIQWNRPGGVSDLAETRWLN